MANLSASRRNSAAAAAAASTSASTRPTLACQPASRMASLGEEEAGGGEETTTSNGSDLKTTDDCEGIADKLKLVTAKINKTSDNAKETCNVANDKTDDFGNEIVRGENASSHFANRKRDVNKYSDVANERNDVTSKNIDVVTTCSDVESKHSNVVTESNDVTKYSDCDTKFSDITKFSDVESKYSDVAKYSDVMRIDITNNFVTERDDVVNESSDVALDSRLPAGRTVEAASKYGGGFATSALDGSANKFSDPENNFNEGPIRPGESSGITEEKIASKSASKIDDARSKSDEEEPHGRRESARRPNLTKSDGREESKEGKSKRQVQSRVCSERSDSGISDCSTQTVNISCGTWPPVPSKSLVVSEELEDKSRGEGEYSSYPGRFDRNFKSSSGSKRSEAKSVVSVKEKIKLFKETAEEVKSGEVSRRDVRYHTPRPQGRNSNEKLSRSNSLGDSISKERKIGNVCQNQRGKRFASVVCLVFLFSQLQLDPRESVRLPNLTFEIFRKGPNRGGWLERSDAVSIENHKKIQLPRKPNP